MPSLVSHKQNEVLIKRVTKEEVKPMVVGLVVGKAPRHNGFPMELYKDFRDLVGQCQFEGSRRLKKIKRNFRGPKCNFFYPSPKRARGQLLRQVQTDSVV